jgi:hypothetical protein
MSNMVPEKILKSNTDIVDESGNAFIFLDLDLGSFILFLDEVKREERSNEGSIIASSAWSISLLRNNVTVMRTCYNVHEEHREETLGGCLRRVDQTGIAVTGCIPGNICKATVLESSDVRKINLLQEKVDSLQNQVGTLTEKLEKIYYAPGMPGYLEAMESFTKGGLAH